MSHKLGRWIFALVVVFLSATPALAAATGALWTTAGHDLFNSRNQNTETKINVTNVSKLAPKWQFTTGGDVSATPASDGTNIYFPDWAGNLYAVNQTTGALLWKKTISSYTGVNGDYARTTPAISGNMLILGDQGGKFGAGAWLMAVNRQNGSLIWKTQVESHPAAIVTQSAVVAGSPAIAYVGTSSFEEALAAIAPGYVCCSFRGSIMAINAGTGQIIWKTYMVPTGYSGGAVWGSTPVVDHARNSLYIGTGNNYSAPASVLQCVANANGNPAAEQACISPNDHFDSAVALDLSTGAIKWATNGIPFDAWNVACIPGFANGSNCPQPAGPDYDFGQGPTLYGVNGNQLLGMGQKSGQYWAFNPSTGAVVWRTQVGPGGITGGLQWGSATDGSRIYVADANSFGQSWALVQNGVASNVTVTSGFWSALDAATGKIVWQTANPTGAQAPGAVSFANGVMYACSADSTGHMYAMNGSTGKILWGYASGGACAAGAAISNGVVYWGSGYSQFFTGNNKVFAFQLP